MPKEEELPEWFKQFLVFIASCIIVVVSIKFFIWVLL